MIIFMMFQYPLFRIVVLSLDLRGRGVLILKFQYPLFRIVVLSQETRNETEN